MIGLCSITFAEKKTKEIIEIAKEAGLETIEWWGKNHVPTGNTANAKEVKKMTEEAGLSVSSYGSYYKIGSGDDFEEVIEAAKALDTKVIRVWAGEKGSEETTDEEFQSIIEESNQLARLAQKEDMSIHYEYHNGSLTDTPESAKRLMKNVDEPNIFMYWQPNESLSVEERAESLEFLGKWVTNVHVFHWTDFYNRFELSEGSDAWVAYIKALNEHAPHLNNYLFEFVKGDSPDQLVKDVQSFKSILAESN